MRDGVKVKVVSGGHKQPTKGSAGLSCHVPGGMTSVSNLAGASGGIKSGNLVDSAVG